MTTQAAARTASNDAYFAALVQQGIKPWNWTWPGSRNRWPTASKPARHPAQRYHGPSPHRKAARERRGRRPHKYN